MSSETAETKRSISIGVVIILLASIIVLSIVIMRPLGVADGGNLYQMMERNGLYYSETPTLDYISTTVMIDPSIKPTPTNLHDTFVVTNRTISRFLGWDAISTKVLAVEYGVLLVVSLIMIYLGGRRLKYGWTNYLLIGLLCMVFLDFSYMLYVNTLYPEALYMVMLLLCVGLRMNYDRNRSIFKLIFMILGIVLMIWVGTTMAIVTAIVMALSLVGKFREGDKLYLATTLIALAVAVFGFFWGVKYQDPQYKQNIYNSVFFGVLNHTSAEDVGLSSELNRLKGVFYTPETAIEYDLDNKFYSKISYSDIGIFYLTHPGALIKELSFSGRNSRDISMYQAGSYEKASGKLPGEKADEFTIYSSIKKLFLVGSMWLICVAIIVFLVFAFMNQGRIKLQMIGLSFANLVTFILPVILCGRVDIGKNMIMYNVLFDILIVFACIGGLRMILQRGDTLREKYGVEQ